VDKEGGKFQVITSNGKQYTSDILMIGTGLGAPNKLSSERGWDQAKTYTTASTNKKDYDGKRVLIVGRGNAAFEFAENILDRTHYVHVLGRSRSRAKGSSGRIKLAWETHYPVCNQHGLQHR
jgi:thioredoxin reductase